MNNYDNRKFYLFVRFTYFARGLIAFMCRSLISLRRKKIILVFGLSRSGTTMLGKFLALNDSSIYIHEPDTDLMKYRFGHNRLNNQVEFWKFVYSDQQKAFRVHGLVCVILLSILNSSQSIKTILIKPISLTDLMKEVVDTLKNVDIIYICRHPAGRSESIIRQRKHDQNIETTSLEYFEMLGEAWGRTNSNIQMLFRDHSDLRWVIFEKLVKEPLGEFRQLYESLGLIWDENIQNEIQQKTTGVDGGFYDIQRDSRKQADKWRAALTEEQIDAIRKGCMPFETNLYDSF